MNYVTFETTSTRLRITLTDAGRVELADMRARQQAERDRWEQIGRGYVKADQDVFYDLIEYELCNGWDTVTSEDIGALSSNPYILSDEIERDDHGTVTWAGFVYAFDAYALRDPLVDLEQNGYVDFTAYSE